MLRPEYPLHTQRLQLRPFRASDASALAAYQSRSDVCRFIPYEPRGEAEILDRIRSSSNDVLADEGDALLLAVIHAAEDALVGDVMLRWVSRTHGTGEIGYVFDPDQQGNGYATEACTELMRLGFAELGLHRIVARADARNVPSIAVMRRLGMQQEAYLRQNEWFKGEWTDEVVFAALASEWAPRQIG